MAKPPPPLSPSSPPSQTSQTKQELTSITQILHLLHHRNKNQHRLLKWYKPFSILRRNIQKLHLEVAALETAVKFSSEGGKGEKYVREAREVVETRVHFLEERVLGEAYLAFSTVVKDLQYAHLGVMLLGMLARIRSVIRPLGKEKPDEEDEDENEEEILIKGNEQVIRPSRGDEEMQDLGEVVRREEVDIPTQEEGQDDEEEEMKVAPKTPKLKRPKAEATPALESDSESRPKKRSKEEKKKKKRKRGDAFDVLFDSLI
ncbi:uncharacterized protein PAC_08851 [Phialocephala subalpina]|uniref:RNase MRP protein 1 RNA binding domain-containing protein n=1 Tax=Phialocephala subalpina TaxID=576137 RepID=A0A1L7X1W1_9HELO|nr:uncharacterized protein PAC_08851 [Phialocephala subalpina]